MASHLTKAAPSGTFVQYDGCPQKQRQTFKCKRGFSHVGAQGRIPSIISVGFSTAVSCPLGNMPHVRREQLCLYNTSLFAGLNPVESLPQGKARTELYPRWPSFFMHTRRLKNCPPIKRSDFYYSYAIDAGLTPRSVWSVNRPASFEWCAWFEGCTRARLEETVYDDLHVASGEASDATAVV